jgi:hypothetical protein
MMTAQDYATIAVAVCTVIGGFATAVRWMVKHYLNELKPNSGSSLKDSVIRLEEKVEILYQMMLQRGRDGN